MGNYNPHQPYILGQEWVPIRDEALKYSPNVNAVELGTAFTAVAARQVRTARFYVNTLQPTSQGFQTALVNIYPYGLEDQTGPIREVIIPVTAATTTGANISLVGGAATIQAAVANPGDGNFLDFDYNSGTPQDASFYFGTNAYPELANKRILNVSLIYAGQVADLDTAQLFTSFVDPDPSTYVTNVRQRNDIGTTGIAFTPPSFYANTGVLTLATSVDNATSQPGAAQLIQALNIGDINNYYEATPGIVTNRRPWRYLDLLKFEQTYGAGRQHIFLRIQLPATAGTAVNPTVPSVGLDYLAMRVIYCEEKRVAYGAQRFGYSYGMNAVTMYDLNFNTDPVLPAGQYLPTLSWVNPGQIDYGAASSGDFPELNALRELYQIPSHPAVQVNVPFPIEERLGDTFVSESIHFPMPQLSLHASGGTLTEPHVYGRQAAAQVYGVNTATQGIYDDVSGVSASYPQVRYYARRFGDTTIPLTLTGVGTLSGSTVSISVASFDALTEILDGWKEVTLRFAAPPAMGTVPGIPGWTWSAAGETSGNRWEILAASAPAISGTPGNLYNQVPFIDRLGSATYYATTTDTAPAFIAAGAAAHADNASITPGLPAGMVADDLMLLWAAIRNSGTGTVDTPAGYTLLLQNGNASLFGKHYDGSEAAPLVTFTGGAALASCSAQMCAFSGLSMDILGQASQLNASAQNIAYPALTTLENSALLWLGWKQDDWTSVNTLAGTTEIGEPSTTLGDDQGIVWDYLISGPIAIGAGSFTVVGGASAISRGSIIALRGTRTTGAAAELTWMPQGVASGWVTGATADPASDAVLIFSQDPPTVTGVSLSQLTQSVSGIGAYCGSTPCCIPTGIGYHQIGWSAQTALPVSGFGAYELQRWDTVTGGDFATIMLSTAASGTSFRDYEARVGVTAVYRIRVLNVLNFAGSWSTYVSGAPPAPGVTGGCGSQDGVLIFTSNSSQAGADNAAYVMQWDSTPNENFDLPESDMVTFQPMYGRDGSIAFHGTERGLEEFSRQVLLQAGAIALPSLADATDIRDLAWAQLPYVCVRDDRGNRWFANVRVSGVNARNNAQNYTASVTVAEQTRTPYPVNP